MGLSEDIPPAMPSFPPPGQRRIALEPSMTFPAIFIEGSHEVPSRFPRLRKTMDEPLFHRLACDRPPRLTSACAFQRDGSHVSVTTGDITATRGLTKRRDFLPPPRTLMKSNVSDIACGTLIPTSMAYQRYAKSEVPRLKRVERASKCSKLSLRLLAAAQANFLKSSHFKAKTGPSSGSRGLVLAYI
ncbi:hypothetical protein GJ744_000697 [Endocarpon pusillum]|uniref:Uncharacterized protein n=1 Tax=Endocarpon pusillum TaxID=364733 RepID=A0A8H7AI17_9EURO|nr:hypothetical protein GJ744_000697 [Endocarpon pusillum]